MTKAKANHLVTALKINDFHYSEGQFHWLKVMKSISMGTLCGNSTTLGLDSEKNWDSAKSKFLQKYLPWKIYNANKMALYYNIHP
jgi:hypothetical protein